MSLEADIELSGMNIAEEHRRVVSKATSLLWNDGPSARAPMVHDHNRRPHLTDDCESPFSGLKKYPIYFAFCAA